MADHLIRLPVDVEGIDDSSFVCDTVPDALLCALNAKKDPWYAHLVNYMVAEMISPSLNKHHAQKLKRDANYYVWDEPHLWRLCNDQIIRKCVHDDEISSILEFCHSLACGGHFGARKTSRKILEAGFYWPTLFKDAYDYCKSCDRCQRFGGLTKRHEMRRIPVIFCDVFDVWGIDFMGPFH